MTWDGGWGRYVSVAERRAKAGREMEKLRKTGHPVSPVTIAGRLIATTFWGKAWCANLESYHDYANRLPRGRTYVRNGSVADLQIASGKATAKVSGSRMYTVQIDVRPVPKPQWQALCRDCVGGIDSLVELLQGRLSKGVMERICRPGDGLFPKPAEITLRCSCPDWATMCKHIAAALYGIGSRLDHDPELLFLLRGANVNDLVAGLEAGLPLSKTGPAAGKVLESDDMSALFGLDMAADDTPPDVPVAVASKPAAKAVGPAVAKPAPTTSISPKATSRAAIATKPPTLPVAAPAVPKGPVAKRPPATAKTRAALKAKLLRALGDRVSPPSATAMTDAPPAAADAASKTSAQRATAGKRAPVRSPAPSDDARVPAIRTSRRKSPA